MLAPHVPHANMTPEDPVVWLDPGGRVIHRLLVTDGHDVVLVCGTRYPVPEVHPYVKDRDHWRHPCVKCHAGRQNPGQQA